MISDNYKLGENDFKLLFVMTNITKSVHKILCELL